MVPLLNNLLFLAAIIFSTIAITEHNLTLLMQGLILMAVVLKSLTGEMCCGMAARF